VTSRPTVSVIVPFAGSAEQLERLIGDLEHVHRGKGDELIVADNRAVAREQEGAVRVYPARGVRAAGFARNRAAAIATGEWLLFIDADTKPSPTLLEDYLSPLPGPSTAVLAGDVLDIAVIPSAVARHSISRRHMSQLNTLDRIGSPYAQTANCAVLRSAFVQVGGFAEDVRSGEDADLCFRLARAGWRLERRPGAQVAHLSREALRPLLRQLLRHGSGAGWLNRRYPGEFPPPRTRELAGRVARSGRTALSALARGDRHAAVSAGLDLVTQSAFDLGRLLPNRARRDRAAD